jgi:hypothetical protein
MDGDIVLGMTEKLDNFAGIATGYKGKLIAAGFSEPAAEQMTVQLHGVMLAQAFGIANQRGKR